MEAPTRLWPTALHVITPEADVRSPMWQKMWERAGVPPASVQWTALDRAAQPGWQPPAGVDGLLLLGELALQQMMFESNLFRWRGRTMRTYRFRTGMPMTLLSTLRVTDLLPRAQAGQVVDQLANRPARFQGVWVRDVQHAMATVGVYHHHEPQYLLNPGQGDWQAWVRDALQGTTPLSFDIETQYTPKGIRSEAEDEETPIAEGALLRIAFSHTPYAGVSVPWQQEYLEGITALLRSARPKLGWNCPTPEHKILTWDQRWVEAGTLTVGDRLLAFDEEIPGPGRRRRYREATVVACERAQSPVMAVTFDDGTVVKVTPEHKWLVARGQACNNARWVETAALTPGCRIAQVLDVWEDNTSRNAGYLAGFFDGEGALGQFQVTASQNAGPLYEHVKTVMAAERIPFKTCRSTTTGKNHKVQKLYVNGVPQMLKFLGTIRPQRLLQNLAERHLGVFQTKATRYRRVVSVEALGHREVVHLETSTHTYLLEGFGAHNCVAFDLPRLRAEGIEVGGRVYDYQDGWHLLQSDLPKGLEWVSSFYTDYAPWKHLSDQSLARYAAIDVDVALQNARGIEADLRKAGQWTLFERHVVDLMPLLARAGRRGNRIDLAYQADLVADMQAEKGRLTDTAQAHVPRDLKPRTTQATQPEPGIDHDVVLVPATVKQCSKCLQTITNKSAHLKGGKKNPCHGADIQLVPGDKPTYAIVEPFNLGSSAQLALYATAHAHPVGFNPKTKQPSMDKTQLEKLHKAVGATHPVYGLALDYSRVAKTLSTYIYQPDAEGLIHTQYVNAPSTGRLASRNYNLQNVGKRESNPWAKKARRQIVAREGHIFVQADSTSIEAVVTGYLIGDPTFVEVAKQSIHAYLTCKELGWAFTPETIEQVKREHKALYNQFKTAVYLLLYGGDPYLMHMTNPELFPTKRSAQDIQRKIFALMPALPAWQTRVREQAKREGVLQSPWGYRHHFYDVYTFKRDGQGRITLDEQGAPEIKLGQDAKRALAFIPQNCAGAFCRDSLLQIGESSWGAYMPANVSVHDGYLLEVPEAMADAAEAFLIKVLTRPVPELGGLQIPCETDRGYNWADWSPDNPRGMRPGHKVLV